MAIEVLDELLAKVIAAAIRTTVDTFLVNSFGSLGNDSTDEPTDQDVVDHDGFQERAKQSITETKDNTNTQDNWDITNMREDLARMRADIQRVRASISTPGHQLLWDAQGLVRASDSLGNYGDPTVREEFQDEITLLRAEAKEVADAAEVAAHEHTVNQSLNQVIHNTSSVKSIIADIDQAIESLRRQGRLAAHIVIAARLGKERAARYRSQKKIDDAKVAEAGGSKTKGERLRREGAELMAQDWAQAFPGEPSPSVPT